MLRFLTAGESHGKALTGILEGFWAGVPLSEEDINLALSQRWSFYGRGPRKNIEKDQVSILSGVSSGLTTGAPISMMILNSDWQKPSDGSCSSASKNKSGLPRPGHADLAGAMKYSSTNTLEIRERASAREMAIRMAIASPSMKLLSLLGIESIAFVSRIGDTDALDRHVVSISRLQRILKEPQNDLLSPNPLINTKWRELIDQCTKSGTTLGGIGEIRFTGLIPGLGSYTHWDRRLDARLACAMMSIPGVKAVAIGNGIEQTSLRGSAAQDQIIYNDGKGFSRKTNYAGGLEGGMTNGENLILKCYMKPPPGPCKNQTIELKTHKVVLLPPDRGDTVAVAPMIFAARYLASQELALALKEKFGCDTFSDLKKSFRSFRQNLKKIF